MKGWLKPLIICIVAGFFWSLAHPSALPLVTKSSNLILNTGWQGLIAWFGMVPVIFVLRPLGGKRLWWYAFAFGVAFFALSIYWLNIAIVLFGNIPLWLSFFIYMALVLICAAQWALAMYVAFRTHQVFRVPLSIVLPVAFVAVEFGRNYIPFGGFPWSNIAYSQYLNLPVLQTAALWGVYGILFLIIWCNALIVELLDWWRSGREANRLPRLSLAAFIALIAFSFTYGMVRLHLNPKLEQEAERFAAAIIQGNVDQDLKNESVQHARAIIDVYRELSAQVPSDVRLVVWPEAAYPYSIPRDGEYLKRIFRGTYERLPWLFLTGVSTMQTVGADRRFYNSAFLLDHDLRVVEIFDKSHLVPFGEYVPFQEILGIRQIVPEAGMFYPGELGNGMQVEDLSMGVLICYEGIFPEITRTYARADVQFLVNLTNDAWYGVSSAPFQHLAFYAFRSVESRKVTLRAANTGVSALVDSSGRIQKPTRLFTRTWLKVDVPKLTERTLYSYTGDWPSFALLLLWFGWWGRLVLRRRAGRHGKQPPAVRP